VIISPIARCSGNTASTLLSVTTRRTLTNKNAKKHVGAHDAKKYAIAHGDIIHIEDSDDEVQYMGTTAALTSTHHMQQQVRTEDIGDHFTGQRTQQSQSNSHEYVSRPSISQRGAMSACPDAPLATNFNASNVGFQDNYLF
jgi:hypothetical protein